LRISTGRIRRNVSECIAAGVAAGVALDVTRAASRPSSRPASRPASRASNFSAAGLSDAPGGKVRVAVRVRPPLEGFAKTLS
jgi:hypothetical protein